MNSKPLFPIFLPRSSETKSNKRKEQEDASEDGSTKRRKEKEPLTQKGVEKPGVKSPMEAALSSQPVLQKIFQHLTFDQLKVYRQVSTLWNTEASKALQNYLMKPVHINYMKAALVINENCMPVLSRKNATVSLKAFRNLVGNSKIFPSTSFQIPAAPLKKSMTFFFRSQGSCVKSLTILPTQKGKKYLIKWLSLYINHLPNLEYLSLTNPEYSYSQVHRRRTDSEPEAPRKLKTLTLKVFGGMSKALLGHFLGLAKELSFYWDSSPQSEYASGVEIFLDDDFAHLLKNVKLHITPEPESLNFCEKMIKNLRHLKSIEKIYFDDPELFSPEDLERVEEILSKLFWENSKTLESIQGIYPLGQFTYLQLPNFPNVTHMGISYFPRINNKNNCNVFPPGVIFADTFPNLKKFKFEFGNLENLEDGRPFEWPMKCLLNVKDLEISTEECCSIPSAWVKEFCDLFPNVTKAKFANVECADCGNLWSLKNLEELELTVSLSIDKDSFALVDSVITGYSKETVLDLYNNILPADLDLSEIDIYVKGRKEKPWIADLEKLRHFSLAFVDYKVIKKGTKYVAFNPETSLKNVLSVKDYVILSHVSTKFGLRLCPKLQFPVRITFRNSTEFEKKFGTFNLSL